MCILNPYLPNYRQPNGSGTNRRFKRQIECQGEFRGCRTEMSVKYVWSGSSIGLGPLFVSCTIVRVEPPSFNSDRAALPLPEHWPCSDSSASGWWSLMSWGNCNPPSSPRETRTRRSDPASLQTQSPNKNGGEKNHNSTIRPERCLSLGKVEWQGNA